MQNSQKFMSHNIIFHHTTSFFIALPSEYDAHQNKSSNQASKMMFDDNGGNAANASTISAPSRPMWEVCTAFPSNSNNHGTTTVISLLLAMQNKTNCISICCFFLAFNHSSFWRYLSCTFGIWLFLSDPSYPTLSSTTFSLDLHLSAPFKHYVFSRPSQVICFHCYFHLQDIIWSVPLATNRMASTVLQCTGTVSLSTILKSTLLPILFSFLKTRGHPLVTHVPPHQACGLQCTQSIPKLCLVAAALVGLG